MAVKKRSLLPVEKLDEVVFVIPPSANLAICRTFPLGNLMVSTKFCTKQKALLANMVLGSE